MAGNPLNLGTRRRNAGAVLVEFALVSVVFFTILLAAIEFAMMFWVDLTMQYAVREGVRCAVTGQTICTGVSTAQKDPYTAVLAAIRANSMGLYDQVTTDNQVFAWTVAADGSPQKLVLPAPKIGIGGQIIVVEVDCHWKLMTPLFRWAFPNGEMDFRVGATMKNES